MRERKRVNDETSVDVLNHKLYPHHLYPRRVLSAYAQMPVPFLLKSILRPPRFHIRRPSSHRVRFLLPAQSEREHTRSSHSLSRSRASSTSSNPSSFFTRHGSSLARKRRRKRRHGGSHHSSLRREVQMYIFTAAQCRLSGSWLNAECFDLISADGVNEMFKECERSIGATGKFTTRWIHETESDLLDRLMEEDAQRTSRSRRSTRRKRAALTSFVSSELDISERKANGLCRHGLENAVIVAIRSRVSSRRTVKKKTRDFSWW